MNLKHYVTIYEDRNDMKWYATAWLQINLFGRCYCFWKKKLSIEKFIEELRLNRQE